MNIALVGEAWGEHEARQRTAFVGPTGYLLTNLLTEAGIRRADCLLTNVFNLKPHMNKIEYMCGPKEQGLYGYPSIMPGKFISRGFKPELDRLCKELTDARPNITVCLGNTAMWAMLGKTLMRTHRGVTQLSTHTLAGLKVLPTYHPAALFKQFNLRPLVVMDLMKALRESASPKIQRPERHIWIEPTLEDIHEFDRRFILPCERLAVDIETAGKVITCIGFAPTADVALVIPFADARKPGRNYWVDPETYHQAVDVVQTILSRPTPKTFQNGLYDITFIWRAWGIKVRNAAEDTMLLHHALQPESLKGLGFLGSVYTDEGSWKEMRKRKTTIKRED
jgi:uracil-DNA glycosylase